MRLCMYKAGKYVSYAEAVKMGGVQEITGIETECQTLFDMGGALADILEAVHATATLFDSSYAIRYVLFDNDGEFLDAN